MVKHVLVLSSTPEVIQKLRDTLELSGYAADVVPADADLVDAVACHKPDLVILAPDLPNAELRAYQHRNMKLLGGAANSVRPRVMVIPLRAVTGCSHDVDTCPDMYVVAPFYPREMAAFVRRLTGHSQG